MATLAAVFTVAGVLISSPLLDMMNTDSSIKAPALEYLNIYIFGLIFLFIYNTCNGASLSPHGGSISLIISSKKAAFPVLDVTF